MRRENLNIALLLIIAVALVAIAVQPIFVPRPAEAQSNSPYPFYIEPGSEMLRAPDGSKQVYGKVVVDLSTGIAGPATAIGANTRDVLRDVLHLGEVEIDALAASGVIRANSPATSGDA